MEFDDETTPSTAEEHVGVGKVCRGKDQFVCLPFHVLAPELLSEAACQQKIQGGHLMRVFWNPVPRRMPGFGQIESPDRTLSNIKTREILFCCLFTVHCSCQQSEDKLLSA
jgi:hypothetical protein